MRTVGSVDLPSATASVAVCLHLHLHAEADLNVLHHNATALAFRALLCLAIFSSSSATLRAIYISRDAHVTTTTKVELFQSNPNVSTGSWTLLAVVSATLKPFQAFLTLLVIYLSLIMVREDLVSSVDLFEKAGSLFITRVLIRVILKR
jgi:hypothetical protein